MLTDSFTIYVHEVQHNIDKLKQIYINAVGSKIMFITQQTSNLSHNTRLVYSQRKEKETGWYGWVCAQERERERETKMIFL